MLRRGQVNDPFRTECPGCEKVLTVDYDGWDIVSSTGRMHITCPVLDLDPSTHTLHEDVNPTAFREANIARIREMASNATSRRRRGDKRYRDGAGGRGRVPRRVRSNESTQRHDESRRTQSTQSSYGRMRTTVIPGSW